MGASLSRNIGLIRSASFEVDWSVVSLSALGAVFRDLLVHLLGAPVSPFENHRNLGRSAWQQHTVQEIYIRSGSMTVPRCRFLVRGVIYDISALIRRKNQLAYQEQLASSESSPEMKDWTSLVDLDINAAPKLDPKNLGIVPASEVIKRLGLDGVINLDKRIAKTEGESEARKSKLEAKQKLEELLGRGDSIRAKYEDKLYQKRLRAEARVEQAKFGIGTPALPLASQYSNSEWLVMPGSAALLRYVEERGIVQGLLARGEDRDFKMFLETLEKFRFQQIRHLDQLNISDETMSGAVVELKGVLDRICNDWNLPSQQVMLVIGGDIYSEAVLQAVANSDFYVCQFLSSPSRQQQNVNTDELIGNTKEKFSFLSWFNKLAEGSLHINSHSKFRGSESERKGEVHHRVKNMRELKWVIEDLNGVSYKRSTMLRTIDNK